MDEQNCDFFRNISSILNYDHEAFKKPVLPGDIISLSDVVKRLRGHGCDYIVTINGETNGRPGMVIEHKVNFPTFQPHLEIYHFFQLLMSLIKGKGVKSLTNGRF